MQRTATPQGQGCRFVSWNVRGVNGAIKRGKAISQLRQLKGDIYFLQETHLKTSEISRIKRPWMSHVFHFKFSARARGAAIIVSKNITFEPTKSIEDPSGRFVAVSGKLFDIPVILVSVYAPVWDDDKFITHLFSSLPDIDSHYPIIGGDFNLIQDPILDRSSSKPFTLSNSATTLRSFANQLSLCDPWRALNPSTHYTEIVCKST
jgi:exonuclease III